MSTERRATPKQAYVMGNAAITRGAVEAGVRVAAGYPGTPIYDKLKKEGRLLTEDWSKYNAATVVFKPKRMDVEELRLAQMAAFGEFFSPSSIFSRLGILPFKKYAWISNIAIAYALRMYYRKKHKKLPRASDLLNYRSNGIEMT